MQYTRDTDTAGSTTSPLGLRRGIFSLSTSNRAANPTQIIVSAVFNRSDSFLMPILKGCDVVQ